MAGANFWGDPESAKDVMRERSELEDALKHYDKVLARIDDAGVLLDLAAEEEDEGAAQEVSQALDQLKQELGRLEAARLLHEPEDAASAIVAINAGAGGMDAQDWAEMLLRQYTRFAERRGFGVNLLDLQEGEGGGIKNATFEVNGGQAYGLLKGESGIHRLVRISPFDANHRRHTSFASVFVSPLVEDAIQIEINEADLRIDVFRASGSGGQHVNKTSSAVRMTHLPTGVVVQCQNEKSQHRNKEIALKVLKARLYEMELRKREEAKRQLHESHQDIAWGSQIRSYVLAPYRLVKDHRTGAEMGNVDAVLDGDLDEFIQAYLLWRAEKA